MEAMKQQLGNYLVSIGLKVVVEELTDPLFLVGEAIWCVLKKSSSRDHAWRKRLLLFRTTERNTCRSWFARVASESNMGGGSRMAIFLSLSADRAMGLEVDRIAGG